MAWAEDFIAVDWGTTNCRTYRIDHRGQCVASFENGSGVLSVAAGGFPAAAAAIRARLGDRPLLMAGMIGSTRGWVEAPYVECPAGLDQLAANLCWVEPDRTAIIPGLSTARGEQADVMRGEEVQLLGAVAAGLIAPDSFICHPGTHNKWVRVRAARIEHFRTVMTGEMFSLLRSGGILADMLTGEVRTGDAFRDGVRRGLDASILTADLFTVRASVLLGRLPRDDAASFTSGMLIGADLRFGLDLSDGSDIMIMGRPELTGLYAEAAAVAGRTAREIDGGAAFIAGALAIARMLP
jgi:2-dehydro-3-deoxygalactonokinase